MRKEASKVGVVAQLPKDGAARSQLPCGGENGGTKARLSKNSGKVIDKEEKGESFWATVAHRRGGGRWVAGEVVLVTVVGAGRPA